MRRWIVDGQAYLHWEDVKKAIDKAMLKAKKSTHEETYFADDALCDLLEELGL